MYKQITIAGWVVEFDPQATSVAYRQLYDACCCGYCRNYRAAHAHLPDELLMLLDLLGVDAGNPVSLTEYYQNPDGTHFYSVFYDVVGRIVSGRDYRSNVCSGIRASAAVELFEGVQVVVTGEPQHAPGHFPDPAVEFEFFFNLPWVLDEVP